MKLSKLLPWLVGLFALIGALSSTLPPGKVRGFDINGFAQLPVLEGGRVKPLDSVARNSLLMIHSKQSLRHEKRSISADEWILDAMFRPQVADKQPLFVIDDPDVLGLIGEQQTTNRYFSFETLAPHIQEIQKQAQTAEPIDPHNRSRFQSAVVQLFNRMYLYHRIKNTVQLAGSPGLAAELLFISTPEAKEHQTELIQLGYFRPLPPLAGQKPDAWQSAGEALQHATSGVLHPALVPLAELGAAYGAGDAAAFNRALANYRSQVIALQPDAVRHARNEIIFNRSEPFYLGMVLYVTAFLVLVFSWLWKPEVLQSTAFALLLVGALVHTTGLAFRIVLQGRPPVTNLYSSAVFVGWAAVILGVIVERMFRKGFGTAVATAAGFASLIVAHHLSSEGDTMEMMRAVLDSNFWLGTHVVTITIGYSGTFLAGCIAIGYTLWKHIAPEPEAETTQALVSMTYGIICFALLFSFVGTVLGGIWADQSWGRFWGWDPKENGALLIVLWNAIILHAKWAGYVKERGIMAMAIFGNIITSFSWFGVNLLGVGLHSYGFTDSGAKWLGLFIGSQVLFMGLCLMPRRFRVTE